MRTFLCVGFLLGSFFLSSGEEKKPKEVAGKADVLRHVKKQFAAFVGLEQSKQVRLHLEGEELESTWALQAGAEIKIDGWWGRLEQFQAGDRVWVWFAVDREKQPVSILMLADELSEMDMHGQLYEVKDGDAEIVTIHVPGEKKVSQRTLQKNSHDLKTGDRGFFQSSRGVVRRFVTDLEFEKLREAQQEWLRMRWKEEGLPGMITFLHPMSGEMEVFLDHEAMRWGRFLEKGAEVVLLAEREIKAQVKFVEPWREKTRIRLVTHSGMDQLDLSSGQRIVLQVPEPPEEVQQSTLPTDIGRADEVEARIDWFLATLYCPCGIAGDRCTGMFYTLASCNVNACGAPHDMREVLAKWMDEGLDDRAIFERLVKEKGKDVWRPHLLR